MSACSLVKHKTLLESQKFIWLLILLFAVFTGLCFLIGAGGLLKIAFPIGSLIIGLVLYRRHKIYYAGFCWWLLFLSPFVSRLADYGSGVYDEKRLILSSPYLVIFLVLPDLLRSLPNFRAQKKYVPFMISFFGIVYAACIGIVNDFSIVKGVIEFLTPLLFGYFFSKNWRDYPDFSRNSIFTFEIGVLAMGGYGIFQYMYAPELDKFWLSKIIEEGGFAFGTPEPLGIRVFSTMHSPGPFAIFLIAGLLLLFNSKSPLQFPAAIVGYLSFLLSLVRSCWLGWFLGVILLFSTSKPRLQMRLSVTILVIILCVIPLSLMEPFSDVISSRVETLADVANDGSAVGRQQIYASALPRALTSWVGLGLGNGQGFDSAILDLTISFGWIGSLAYVSGIFLLLAQLFQSAPVQQDSFVQTSRSIVVVMLTQLLFGNVLIVPSGMILWGFLGLGLAGCQYHKEQYRAKIEGKDDCFYVALRES